MKLSNVCRISIELEFKSENNFIWKQFWPIFFSIVFDYPKGGEGGFLLSKFEAE